MGETMSEEIKALSKETYEGGQYLRNAGVAFGILVTFGGIVMVIAGLIPVCRDGSSDCYNAGLYNIIPLTIPGLVVGLSGLVVGFGAAAIGNFISLRSSIISSQN